MLEMALPKGRIMTHCPSPFALAAVAVAALALAATAHAESMGALHCNDDAGAPRRKGETVTVSGVVTAQFSTARSAHLFLQDATGAIGVYASPKNCAAVGDSLRVTGVVSSYNGLTQLAGTAEQPVRIDSLGRAARVPEPLVRTLAQLRAAAQADGCEPDESRLVRVENVLIRAIHGERPAAGATFGDDTNYLLVSATDSTSTLPMRVVDPEGCDLSRSLEGHPIPAEVPVGVTGILSQFTGRNATTGGYQLLPRGRDDVQPMPAATRK